MNLDICKAPKLCPWGVRPQVGMWGKVDGIEFFGTNCLLYTDCPSEKWNPRVRARYKAARVVTGNWRLAKRLPRLAILGAKL